MRKRRLVLFNVLAVWFSFKRTSILNLIYELFYVQEDVFQSMGCNIPSRYYWFK